MSPSEPVKLGVISLGCPRNLVDTERALGQFDRQLVAEPLGKAAHDGDPETGIGFLQT
jgi:tRNA A37 methylthiotransferase MiaB